MDFVAYTTLNYQILTDVWYKTLQEVPVDKKIFLKVDDISSNYNFADDFYLTCIENKLQNLLHHEPSQNCEFIVSSDCDIQFFKNGDWGSLLNDIRNSRNKIFFMRDCTPEFVNGGFYIIKREYFETYKKFIKKMLVQGFKDFHLLEQSYINEHRKELEWEFISDEYITPSENWRWDLSRICLHHAISTPDLGPDPLMNKLKTMHRVKTLIEQKDVPEFLKIQGDYVLVVSKYKENTNWTKKYAHVVIYDKFKGDLPNIGREAHTYLTYIVNNYDNLPSHVYFSQGLIEDHKIDESIFKTGKYSSNLIDSYMDNGHIKQYSGKYTFPKEKLDIKSWFHKYIDETVNLDEPIHIWWNAIFPVSRECILSRPKEYYEMLLDLIPNTNNPEIGHYFERSWYYIFNCHYFCGYYLKIHIDKNKKINVIENNHKNYNEMKLSRHASTIKMLEKLENIPSNITFYINTDDLYNDKMLNYFGNNSIPDFGFEHWPTSKLPKFYDLYNQKPIDFTYKKNKLLWIGNINVHKHRKYIYEKYNTIDNFEIISMKWDDNGNPYPYKTIYEHGEYKYLLDVQGRGWSARLKYLLLLGSVVFIVNRPETCKEYWHDEFKPWIHYVPVKEDCSDLIENFNIMYNNQEKSLQMAIECHKKAIEIFSAENVNNYFVSVLYKNVSR